MKIKSCAFLLLHWQQWRSHSSVIQLIYHTLSRNYSSGPEASFPFWRKSLSKDGLIVIKGTDGTLDSAKMGDDSVFALPDRIADSFSGKSIFITGGTGFIGKVLVEKVLRRCPDVGIIYMLIRPKKGKSAQQRLAEMFSDDFFHLVRDKYTLDELSSKVILIEGDITSEDLKLTQQNKDLCSKAEIVIHSAACIRFDADIKESITLNTRGTKFVLEFAKEFKNLELFVYVSTAYCHPEETVLEEKAYKPRYDPHEMIRVVEVTDEHTLCALTPAILSDLPNSYTLSKALAEALVEEASNELPTLTLRPSVVIPILEEPLPGWSDNLNGPSGLLIAAGKGVLRSYHGDGKNHIDAVPVDVVINGVMAAVWNYLKNGDHRRYMNLTSTSEVIVPWSCLFDAGEIVTYNEVPFNNTLWAPAGGMTKCIYFHKLRALLFHWIPAILIDILLVCFGYKPILKNVHLRISKGVEVIDYYVKNQWIFDTSTIKELRDALNAREKALYTLGVQHLDLLEYVKNSIKCARLYILKESEESLPAARRHITRLKYLNYGVTVLFWWFVAKFTGIPLALGMFALITIYNRFFVRKEIVIYKK